MQFLPLIDAARISVLCRKWRSNWLSIPQLVFDDEFADPIRDKSYEFDACKWSSVISNILLLHEGPTVRFSLTIPFQLSSPSHADISPWISFVSRNGVKSLPLFNDSYRVPLFKLPSYFFSFFGLENLLLRSCTVGRLPYFRGLGSLVSLKLFDIVFEAGIFKEFIACCPLLEILMLTFCRILDPLIINMPKLKILNVSGLFWSISFKNASSLLSISLGSGNVDSMEGAADMIEFLASSCGLQRLSLHGNACKEQGDTKNDLEYTFNHLRNIYITDIRGLTLEMKLISCLLAFSASLERLSFTCHGTLKAHTESRLYRQMLQYRRASPKVEIVYVK